MTEPRLPHADDVKYEEVAVEQLKEYPGNARIGDVETVRESLRVNGQYKPIVVQRDTNYVLAGNHTLKAAIAEGWEKIDVRWVDVDSDGARRINIVDNRSNDLATYNDSMLDELLRELDGNYLGTGFDPLSHKELQDILAVGGWGKAKKESVPPLGDDGIAVGTRVELGDDHLLVCGDCTLEETWKLVGRIEGQVDLVITDPPYMVSYDSSGKDGDTRRTDVVPNDNLTSQQADELINEAFRRIHAALKPGGCFYVFGPTGPEYERFLRAARENDLKARQGLVWVKHHFVVGRSDYHYQHESVMYGWKPGAAHFTSDDHTLSSVLEFDKPAASKEHPTMKPVEMLEVLIEKSSRPGDLVLDVFGGSGSTMVAALANRRRSISIELDGRYAQLIRDRYANLTGGES